MIVTSQEELGELEKTEKVSAALEEYVWWDNSNLSDRSFDDIVFAYEHFRLDRLLLEVESIPDPLLPM